MANINKHHSNEWRRTFGNIGSGLLKDLGTATRMSLSDMAPGTFGAISSSAQVMRDARESVSQMRTQVTQQGRALKRTLTGRDAARTINDAFNDIREGTFDMGKITGEAYDTMDYFDSQIDQYDMDMANSDDPDMLAMTESKKNTALIGRAITQGNAATIEGLDRMTTTLANVQMKATDAQTKQLQQIMLTSAGQTNAKLLGISSKIDAVNSNLMAIMDFHRKNTAILNKSTMEYQKSTTMMLGQIGQGMAEIRDFLQFQRDLIEKQNQPQHSARKRSQLFDFSSGFNASDYVDMVKKNFKTSSVGLNAGMYSMMLPMMMMGGESPIAMAMSMVLPNLIPSNMRRSIGRFDKSISHGIDNALRGIGRWRNSSNDFKKMIGEIFGIREESLFKGIDTSNFKKDSMGWNGIAQKTLVEVIPGYLARIESALTKQDERFFDMEKGKFRTRRSLEREYKETHRNALQWSANDLTDQVKRMVGGDTANRERIMDAVSALYMRALRDPEHVDMRATLRQIEQVMKRSNRYGTSGGFTSKEIHDVQRAFKDAIGSAKNDIRDVQDMFDAAGAYRNLFNEEGRSTDHLHRFGNVFSESNDFVRNNTKWEDMTSFEKERWKKDHDRWLEAEKKRKAEGGNSAYNWYYTQGDVEKEVNKVFKKLGLEKLAQRANSATKKVSGKIDDASDWIYGKSVGSATDADISFVDDLFKKSTDKALFTNISDATTAGIARGLKASGGNKEVISRLDKLVHDVHDIRNYMLGTGKGRRHRGRHGARSNTRRQQSRINQLSQSTTNNLNEVVDMPASQIEHDARETSATITTALVPRGNAAMVHGDEEDDAAGPSRALMERVEDNENSLKALVVSLNNNFLKPIVGGIFGKDGFFRRIFTNDTVKKFIKSLFDEKEGVFGSVTSWAKDRKAALKHLIDGKGYTRRDGTVVGDSDNSVFGHLSRGYNFVHSNTMKYLFGDDFENNATYQKYLGWTGRRRGRAATINTGSDPILAEAEAIYAKLGDDVTQKKNLKKKIDDYKKAKAENPERAAMLGERMRSLAINIQDDVGRRNIAGFNIDIGAGGASGSNSLPAVINDVSNTALERGNQIIEATVGGADAPAKLQSSYKKTSQSFMKRLKDFLPIGLAGAGIGAIVGTSTMLHGTGILGSLFLPGGPVGGAVLGIAGALLSRSEKFKNFLFGEEKDGKRVGGVITEKQREAFKKSLPLVVGSATVGAISSIAKGAVGLGGNGILLGGLLPGGPLGGAILGLGLGLLKNNDRFNEILWGKQNKDGTRGKGILTGANSVWKKVMDSSGNFIKGGAGGILAGLGTGFALSKMGILGGALAAGGPVMWGLTGLGIGIASQTEKFKALLFGDKIDEEGHRTGDGLLSKAANMLSINVFEPIRESLQYHAEDFAHFLKKNISYPFREAFGPIADSLHTIKVDIKDAIRNAFNNIASTVGGAFKIAIKDLFGPITSGIGKLGKGAVSVATAGLKFTLLPVSGGLNLMKLMTGSIRNRARKGERKTLLSFEGLRTMLGGAWEEAKARNAAIAEEGGFGGPLGGLNRLATFGLNLFGGFNNAWGAAKQGYRDEMAAQGFNSFGWRSVDDERKALNKQRKKALKDREQWNKIGAISKELAASNGYANLRLSETGVEDFKARLKRAGIDSSIINSIETSDDINELVYHRGDFKNRLLEGKEKEQLPSQQSQFYNTMSEYMKPVYRFFTQRALEQSLERKKKINIDDMREMNARMRAVGLTWSDLGYNITEKLDLGSMSGAQFDSLLDDIDAQKGLEATSKKSVNEILESMLNIQISQLQADHPGEVSEDDIKKARQGDTSFVSDKLGKAKSKLMRIAKISEISKARRQREEEEEKAAAEGAASFQDEDEEKKEAGLLDLKDKSFGTVIKEKAKGLFSSIFGGLGSLFANPKLLFGLTGAAILLSDLIKPIASLLKKVWDNFIYPVIRDHIAPRVKNFLTETVPDLLRKGIDFVSEHADSILTAASEGIGVLGELLVKAGGIIGDKIAESAKDTIYEIFGLDKNQQKMYDDAKKSGNTNAQLSILGQKNSESIYKGLRYAWLPYLIPNLILGKPMDAIQKSLSTKGGNTGKVLSAAMDFGRGGLISSIYKWFVKNPVGNLITDHYISNEEAGRRAIENYEEYQRKHGKNEGNGPGMMQSDPRWGNMPIGVFPNGQVSTMATGGCGPTALSMIAQGFGPGTSPIDVASYAMQNGMIQGGGATADLFTKGASDMGLQSHALNKTNLRKAIGSGQPVIVSGKSAGNGPYTSAGHIVAVHGTDARGNAIVGDPMRGTRSVPIDQLTSGMTHGWSYSNAGYGPGYGMSTDNSLGGIGVTSTSKPMRAYLASAPKETGINWTENVNPDGNLKTNSKIAAMIQAGYAINYKDNTYAFNVNKFYTGLKVADLKAMADFHNKYSRISAAQEKYIHGNTGKDNSYQLSRGANSGGSISYDQAVKNRKNAKRLENSLKFAKTTSILSNVLGFTSALSSGGIIGATRFAAKSAAKHFATKAGLNYLTNRKKKLGHGIGYGMSTDSSLGGVSANIKSPANARTKVSSSSSTSTMTNLQTVTRREALTTNLLTDPRIPLFAIMYNQFVASGNYDDDHSITSSEVDAYSGTDVNGNPIDANWLMNLGGTGWEGDWAYKYGFPFYHTADERWGDKAWRGSNVAQRGSDLASLAMVATAFSPNRLHPAYILDNWIKEMPQWIDSNGGLDMARVFSNNEDGFNSMGATQIGGKRLGVQSLKNPSSILSAMQAYKPVVLTGNREKDSIWSGGVGNTGSLDDVATVVGRAANGSHMAILNPHSTLEQNDVYPSDMLKAMKLLSAYAISDPDGNGIEGAVDIAGKTGGERDYVDMKKAKGLGKIIALFQNIAAVASHFFDSVLGGTPYRSIFDYNPIEGDGYNPGAAAAHVLSEYDNDDLLVMGAKDGQNLRDAGFSSSMDGMGNKGPYSGKVLWWISAPGGVKATSSNSSSANVNTTINIAAGAGRLLGFGPGDGWDDRGYTTSSGGIGSVGVKSGPANARTKVFAKGTTYAVPYGSLTAEQKKIITENGLTSYGIMKNTVVTAASTSEIQGNWSDKYYVRTFIITPSDGLGVRTVKRFDPAPQNARSLTNQAPKTTIIGPEGTLTGSNFNAGAAKFLDAYDKVTGNSSLTSSAYNAMLVRNLSSNSGKVLQRYGNIGRVGYGVGGGRRSFNIGYGPAMVPVKKPAMVPVKTTQKKVSSASALPSAGAGKYTDKYRGNLKDRGYSSSTSGVGGKTAKFTNAADARTSVTINGIETTAGEIYELNQNGISEQQAYGSEYGGSGGYWKTVEREVDPEEVWKKMTLFERLNVVTEASMARWMGDSYEEAKRKIILEKYAPKYGFYASSEEVYVDENGNEISGYTISTSDGTTISGTTGSTVGGTIPVSTDGSAESIWLALRAAGLTKEGAAGVMGNLYAESGLRSNNLQNSYEKSFGLTDDAYTSGVDNGSYINFVNDKAGYGLAQWTSAGRKQNLLNYARGSKRSIGDSGMQTAFLLEEMKSSYPSVYNVVTSSNSVRDSSNAMLHDFERPKNQSASVEATRIGYSNSFLNQYGNVTSPSGAGANGITVTLASPAVSGAVTSNAGGSPKDWMNVVKAVKQAIASSGLGYNQQGYLILNIFGKQLKVRRDCSGYVSACVSIYSGQSFSCTSSSLCDGSNPQLMLCGFTKIPFTGWNNLKEGDIIAKHGHTEIYSGYNHMVYTCGSTSSIKNPGPTNSGSTTYEVVWRPAFSGMGTANAIMQARANNETPTVGERSDEAAAKNQQEAMKKVDSWTRLEDVLKQHYGAGAIAFGPGINPQSYFSRTLGGGLTAGYGPSRSPLGNYFHRGIDIGAAYGRPVTSPVSGTVVASGYDPAGYGNYTVVQDRAGNAHVFGHMGQTVGYGIGTAIGRGMPLGTIGMTGNTTGPHLHYEIRKNGSAFSTMDPTKFNYKTLSASGLGMKVAPGGAVGGNTAKDFTAEVRAAESNAKNTDSISKQMGNVVSLLGATGEGLGNNTKSMADKLDTLITLWQEYTKISVANANAQLAALKSGNGSSEKKEGESSGDNKSGSGTKDVVSTNANQQQQQQPASSGATQPQQPQQQQPAGNGIGYGIGYGDGTNGMYSGTAQNSQSLSTLSTYHKMIAGK